MKRLCLGAHVSAAGGVYNAITNAEALGAECIQIFGSSPRQWQVRVPSVADVKKFKELHAKSRVRDVYLHAAYLVNLASPEAATRKKSVESLAGHLKIADALGAKGLIFHIGSGKTKDREWAVAQAVKGMREALKRAPGKTWLIMENAAGGGAKLGFDAKEMGALMRGVRSSRVKVCFDTAHAFESGIIEYALGDIKKEFDAWEREVGLKNIVAIHANDSKTPFGSKHDRHENVGEGYIGMKGFRALAKEKRLWDKAWILEVPGFEGTGPDKKNLARLRSCFK